MIKSSACDKSTSRLGADENIDWLISIGLAALVVATRLPFRTSMLYNWDSANFALGMRYFDVRVHAPHPPGYFFYIAVANLANAIIGEANASLVALSILFSAGAVATTYFLGKAMYNRFAGLMASLLLAFSVTFWTYGELALAYVSLAFFSSLVALFAWRIVAGKSPSSGFALLLSTVYAVGSGFRPDLLIFLGPLWLWSFWRQGWNTRLFCLAATVVGFLLWYVPTALLSGGFTQYHAVLAAYIQTDVAARYSSTHKGIAGLVVNVRDTLSYVFYALYAAALPLAAAGLWFLALRKLRLSRKSAFFVVWVAPMVLFYTVIHIGDPGYVFTFLPALVVLLGAFLSNVLTITADYHNTRPYTNHSQIIASLSNSQESRHSPRWRRSAGAVILVVILSTNVGIFLFHARPMTAQGIRQNDLDYREKIEFITSQVNPRSTILLSYDSYKHLLYYLPDYRQSIWVDVFADAEGHVRIPPGVNSVLLVDARLNAINRSQQVTRQIELPSGAKLYSVAAVEGQVLTVGGRAIEVHD